MKKQLSFFLIIIFVLGLTPTNFSFAITQNQINAEVQIVCPVGDKLWSGGSGTIIDPKGIILTNRHVVQNAEKNTCFIGFVESIGSEPNFGTTDNPNLAEVKYLTTTDDMDAAILYLSNPTNKIYPSVDVWNSDSSNLKFGDKLEVIGFPSIGGSTITYTSGDFSGFGSASDGTQNYIKTTAPLEHGNSGGGAYDPQGRFIGIPSMVVSGPLNSLSYVLTVNSIKNWLSGFLSNNYKQAIVEQKPVVQKPSVSIQNDVTPPDINDFHVLFQRYLQWNEKENIYSDAGTDWKIDYAIGKYNKLKFTASGAKDNESGINGYYYYVGTDINANPVTAGKFQRYADGFIDEVIKLENEGTYYFIIAVKDNAGNISNRFIATYVYENENYRKINSIEFFKNKQNTQSLGSYNFKFSSGDTYLGDGLWSRIDGSKQLNDVLSCKTRLKNLYFKWDYDGALNNGGSVVAYANTLSLSDLIKGNEAKNNSSEILTINTENKIKAFYYTIADYTKPNYGAVVFGPNNQIYYNVYIKPASTNNLLFNNHRILSFVYDSRLNTDITCVSEYDIYNTILERNKKYDYYNQDIGFNSLVKSTVKTIVPTTSTLTGYILLQVESHGEAWYVNPADGKRYYMKDGAIAYQMMRNFGLGITNADLAKIPQENEANNYPSSVNKLKGKILLQVQEHGEAWYVNPKTGYRYYMKDGDAAYNLMRFHSLGITNKDLEKIPEGVLNQ